jgi:hypothetical protein
MTQAVGLQPSTNLLCVCGALLLSVFFIYTASGLLLLQLIISWWCRPGQQQ